MNIKILIINLSFCYVDHMYGREFTYSKSKFKKLLSFWTPYFILNR